MISSTSYSDPNRTDILFEEFADTTYLKVRITILALKTCKYVPYIYNVEKEREKAKYRHLNKSLKS